MLNLDNQHVSINYLAKVANMSTLVCLHWYGYAYGFHKSRCIRVWNLLIYFEPNNFMGINLERIIIILSKFIRVGNYFPLEKRDGRITRKVKFAFSISTTRFWGIWEELRRSKASRHKVALFWFPAWLSTNKGFTAKKVRNSINSSSFLPFLRNPQKMV